VGGGGGGGTPTKEDFCKNTEGEKLSVGGLWFELFKRDQLDFLLLPERTGKKISSHEIRRKRKEVTEEKTKKLGLKSPTHLNKDC